VQVFAISKSTKDAIIQTWDSIAWDAYEMCENDNDIAIELTVDASRLTMNGFAEADQELKELYKQYGYAVVRDALSKTIQLL